MRSYADRSPAENRLREFACSAATIREAIWTLLREHEAERAWNEYLVDELGTLASDSCYGVSQVGIIEGIRRRYDEERGED